MESQDRDHTGQALIACVVLAAVVFVVVLVMAVLETFHSWRVDDITPAAPVCGLYRVDIDGRVMVPSDLNGDGKITGDIEMGS